MVDAKVHVTSATRWGLMLAAACLMLSGCGSGQAGPPSSAGPTSSPASSNPAPAPAATATPTPPSAGVSIRYEGSAQVELLTKGAPRVLIDVGNPSALSSPPTSSDILLTTHSHPDHMSYAFVESFPGKQLSMKEGSLEAPGVSIQGVAAAHTPTGGTDYLYVVDIGGLRIAHLGDDGQTHLTARQLKALGSVDVAVTQFENSFSQMDVKNKNGFKLMAQLKPKLIIQSHSSMDAVKYAATLWPILYSKQPVVTITKARLPKQTTLLLVGSEGAYYTETVKARTVKW